MPASTSTAVPLLSARQSAWATPERASLPCLWGRSEKQLFPAEARNTSEPVAAHRPVLKGVAHFGSPAMDSLHDTFPTRCSSASLLVFVGVRVLAKPRIDVGGRRPDVDARAEARQRPISTSTLQPPPWAAASPFEHSAPHTTRPTLRFAISKRRACRQLRRAHAQHCRPRPSLRSRRLLPIAHHHFARIC